MSGKSSIKLVMTIILLQGSDKRDVTFIKFMLQVLSISRLNATIVNIILRVMANEKKMKKKECRIIAIAQHIYIYNIAQHIYIYNKQYLSDT